MISPEYYWDLLRQRFDGQKVILATGMVASAGRNADWFQRFGAPRPLLLGEGIGTGAMPSEQQLEWVVICPDENPGGMMEEIYRYDQCLASLPDDARAAIEAFDPDGTALVLRGLTVRLEKVGGRRVYGYRRPEWAALEDKTIVDDLWDAVGVTRAPAEVVAAERDALLAAAKKLDRGDGTVWAADTRDGWHGGAQGIRIARDPERWIEWAVGRCDCVRVMPFLRGVPCSIHGIVFSDYVASLRPVESVTFVDESADEFRYGGCATFWDPPDARRDEMREMVRKVGAALRERVDFRGTFTVDGVMTADGFRPTELNSRFGAGISVLSGSLPDLPLYWIDQAICEGEHWDFRPRELEELILDAGDRVRAGGSKAWSATRRDETVTVQVVYDTPYYRRAADVEAHQGTIDLGPSPLGSFMKFTLQPDGSPIGESVAPRALAALSFCESELGVELNADRLRTCE